MRPARTRLRLAGWLLMLVLALLLSACGGGDETADEGTGDETSETDDDGATDDGATEDGDDGEDGEGDGMAAGEAVTLELAESDAGEHIVDGDGNALYLFTNDEQGAGESACTGGCAENWPALTTDGDVTTGESLDSELVDTLTREDDAQQVTYNGWPLYYYAGDESPGDTNGQGQGGVWFLVDAAGEMIEGS